jgi:hypothetical protein
MSDRLRLLVAEFVHTVSAANRHHDRKHQGGQHVTFTGDFCNAPPSVMSRLTWWAREMDKAMREEDAK